MTSSQPPVPARLREMLNAYPTYLEQIQQLLWEVASEPAASPRLEQAIWALEGRASRLFSEAKDELKAAKQSSDPEQIAIAEQKELLMGAVVTQKPWLGDMDFVDYFRSQGTQ